MILKNPDDPNDISFTRKQDPDSSILLNDSIIEEERLQIEVSLISTPD
jgi:hypothetical protein